MKNQVGPVDPVCSEKVKASFLEIYSIMILKLDSQKLIRVSK